MAVQVHINAFDGFVNSTRCNTMLHKLGFRSSGLLLAFSPITHLMMDQARSSKFVENFDDDTSVSSSSSESLSPSTPSPKPTSQKSLSPGLIVRLFSALSLEETTSRCPDLRCKDLRCKSPHAQDGQPTEIEVETSFENLFARLKDHQERMSREKSKHCSSQHESNITIERSSIEIPNTVLSNMLEEHYGEVKSRLFKELEIPLEVVYRGSKLEIETKFESLVQDLQLFNDQRHAIFCKFQVCFAYHEQINESPNTCPECLQHLRNIKKNYHEARLRVASVIRELETCILASRIDFEIVRQHVPDYAEDFANNYGYVQTLVLKRLQLLQRMLNSLDEDVEKAKRWQDLWADTFALERPQSHEQKKENPNGKEEAKEHPEQSEAKEEPSSDSLTAKDYQDARIETAESHKAHEKSEKGKSKQSKKKRKH